VPDIGFASCTRMITLSDRLRFVEARVPWPRKGEGRQPQCPTCESTGVKEVPRAKLSRDGKTIRTATEWKQCPDCKGFGWLRM
jgi:hypothetical protein